MGKSKLIDILSSLSADEIKKVGDFVESPYFNKNKTVVRFFYEIKKAYPDFPSKKTDKKKICNKLFKGKKFNEQVFKNLSSELIKLCKEFLETEFYRKNTNDRKLNLINNLNEKRLDAIFNTEANMFEKTLTDASKMSDAHFYYLYKLEESKIGFHLERNEQPLVFDKVLKSGEHLVLFFMLHLTKTISNLIVNRISFNKSFNANLPEEFLNYLDIEKLIEYMKEKDIQHSNILELYYLRVLCNMKPENEMHYYKFKKLLFDNIDSYNRDIIYGLFNALETYCTQKINSGNNKFLDEFFHVFETEIRKGFYKFSESSPVTFMKFRNTYLTALRLKKIDWAEKFINEFKSDLIEIDRENILEMAFAQLSFEKKNFEKAIEHLQNVKTDQFFLKVDAKNISLMAYYELEYTEQVISLIDSYKHFLSGNKFLSDEYKENSLRFINALYALTLNQEKNDKGKLAALKDKIFKYKSDGKMEWLLEKIKLAENS